MVTEPEKQKKSNNLQKSEEERLNYIKKQRRWMGAKEYIRPQIIFKLKGDCITKCEVTSPWKINTY